METKKALKAQLLKLHNEVKFLPLIDRVGSKGYILPVFIDKRKVFYLLDKNKELTSPWYYQENEIKIK